MSSICFNSFAATKQAPLHVGFGIDATFLPAMSVTVRSLVAQNPDMPFVVHVVMAHIPSTDKAILELFARRVGVTLWLHLLEPEEFARLPQTGAYPSAAYNRLFLPKFLKDITDRVLYLDADIVCIGPLPALPDLVGDDVFAAAFDVEQISRNQAIGRDNGLAYFNSGVLYIDLQRWQTVNYSERVTEYLNRGQSYPFADQDILNLLTEGRFVQLGSQWNTFWTQLNSHPSDHRDAVFLHYSGNKPWHPWSINYLDRHFAPYTIDTAWPLARFNPLKSRLHRRLYARHLMRSRDFLGAAVWFFRYLRTPRGIRKP